MIEAAGGGAQALPASAGVGPRLAGFVVADFTVATFCSTDFSTVS